MKVIARIGNSQDSMKILIKRLTKVVNGRIFTECVIGNPKNEYYSLIHGNYPRNPENKPNELIPRKEVIYLVESDIEDATFIEANGYTQECVHLGGDKFMMFEKVKLWDNTITGLNCLSHNDTAGKYGATIFKVGETAKNVTYYKTYSRDEFMKKYNSIDFLKTQPF